MFSVILTVYKRTEYLAEALRSVLDQSFPDFEIIVADDSGTAAAREIVANCGDLDRVKYLPNPTTLGVVRKPDPGRWGVPGANTSPFLMMTMFGKRKCSVNW